MVISAERWKHWNPFISHHLHICEWSHLENSHVSVIHGFADKRSRYDINVSGCHSDMCIPIHISLVICVSRVGIQQTLMLIHDTIRKYLLLLKEMSSISSNITSNTTRVTTGIKQHAKVEYCGARRRDTHITGPAQRYVYPLSIFWLF